MENFKILNVVKQIYDDNKNIMDYLKNTKHSKSNTIEDIMISYDFQAGTYIKHFEENKNFAYKYCGEISKIINSLGEFENILEAGVGEATTLGLVVSNLKNINLKYYGFDISWSRIKYARNFMDKIEYRNYNLFTGDLFNIPIKDNSIDIVYTSHSIEPNGGKEIEALKELYRITNKYLILLEPSYEFATNKARERMIKHGYITNLYESAIKLGYNVIEHRLFNIIESDLNPTGIMIIEKNNSNTNEKIHNTLCCPISKTNLTEIKGSYYSKDSMLVFPIIDQIPCLLPQNAILATKFLDNI